MDGLEEFEVRRHDLFDLVELKSIDDRLELAKLMVASTDYSSNNNNINNQNSPT